MTYTDVTPIQLFGGWVLIGLWVFVKVVRWLFKDANPDYQEINWQRPAREITGREYKDLVSPYIFERDRAVAMWDEEKKRHERDLGALLQAGIENTRLIDKAKSLEAQLARLTVRPRSKDGRFKKGGNP